MTNSVAVFPPGFRVTDADDQPISGATIEFYGAGTSTPKTVYSDQDLTVAIGVTVTTDAGGYPYSSGNKVLVYTNTAPYKIIIKDDLGATIATHDNVRGAIDASSSGGGGGGTSNAFGLAVGDVKLSLAASPDAGFIRLLDTPKVVNKADYPDLNDWAADQGYPWGVSSLTFTLPAAGGYFLRFAASGATIDPSGPRSPGSTQLDAFKSHDHAATSTVTDPGHFHSENTTQVDTVTVQSGSGAQANKGNTAASTGSKTTGITVATTITASGDTETRAKNVAFYADMLATPASVASGLVGASGLTYEYKSSTSAADTTSGTFILNNATISSATEFYISETDGLGSNLATVLQSVPSGSSFYMSKVGSPAVFISFVLSSAATDSGTYKTFTITSASSGGTLADGDQFSIIVMRAGSTGANGTSGTDPGIRWSFETSTTMGAPASGGLRLDNATIASVTAAAVSASCAETGNPSVLAWLQSWDDSTTTTHRGTLIIKKSSAPQNFAIFFITGSLTDNTSWVQLALTHVSSSGSFSASDTLSVQFVRTGNAGSNGVGAGDVTAASNITDARIVVGDGGSKGIKESAAAIDASGNVTGFRSLALPTIPNHGFATPINVGLSGTVAASALTITLTGADGNAPSSTNPIYVPFRNATAATGTPSWLATTSSLTLVLSSGSTVATVANVPFRLWVGMFDDGGTGRLGVIQRITGGSTPTAMAAVTDDMLASSTAEGGAGAADSAGVFYTGTAVTSKAFRVLGYMEWSSGLATPGTWSSGPTKIQLFGPGVPAPGAIIQIVQAATSTATTTTSTSYVDTNLTASITLSAACNLVDTAIVGALSNATNTGAAVVALFRGSTQIGVPGQAYAGAGQSVAFGALTWVDAPASASAITYKAKLLGQGGVSASYNGVPGTGSGGAGTGGITLKEIMA